MAHVEDLVHLCPRCTALLLDQVKERGDGEHIVLDDVLPFDEVKHLSLSSSRAVHHPVDLGAKLVEDRLDDRGIGTCRGEDEPSCIEGGACDGLGECLRATIDEVVRCSGIVALGEATG